MCQASPGPRCYNDSNKRMDKLTAKLNKAEADLKVSETALNAAAVAKDFNAYSKLKKKNTVLTTRVNELASQVRHTQRDIDSTLTGRKLLEEKIAKATSKSELDALDVRRRTAEALRFNREHALSLKKSGQVPAIRFTSSLRAA